ncbi:toll-like receptor 21 [Tachysurus fulvidraco]|uniref:Toll-like receptor 21 n=1 Tax=Tachysurus fulvidraco TaxID=1234273 RepID=A0A1Y9TFP0_TACFU|nr:toll-like receptor 21 [Tachysurus fulvidraco]XP_047667633.1 toll-like receptor 21 [Tachysurus fulvidraco]XP_047667634.1 toll-like receptor 21 [Tachysurus fulvidraco]XP_047667635.1 toll-like receptor 21 [Tachysurus fulvidraco]XP_047667636.1 toll-like receptor 21 [Tachysurus fulvidraco]AQY78353.1 toll-like receptor 21 [Tachysurus fulvidraco]
MARYRNQALISVTIIISVFQLSMSYSFMNCIENAGSNNTTFKCINRQAQRVADFVGDIPQSATNISISDCKLDSILNDSFSNQPQLRVLLLNNNQIKRIDKDAFGNLQYLHTLNLSSNYIVYLDSPIFQNLQNLSTLLLANNRLTNISSELFSSLSKLEILDLQKNQLKDFSAVVNSISNLKVLKKLDISSNRLITLLHSANLPQSLSHLSLGNNELTTLDCRNDFLSKVKFLDLSYNRGLSAQAFFGLNLSSLTYLGLHFTNISIITLLNHTNVIPWHVNFSGLALTEPQMISLCKQLSYYPNKHIKKMVLQNNELKDLNDKTLSDCPTITDFLDLSNNQLKSIGCFQFLERQKHLARLRLEHNHFSELLSCKHGKKFLHLKELSFRYNRILKVNSFAFSHTPNLTTLQLNINIIAYLDRKALTGLKDLITLRLDNNLLSDIYNESFEDLQSLQILNLRNNQISVIFNNTFYSLSQLRILDLGGNKITQLMPLAFVGLDSLNNLYLDRNRLKNIDGQLIGSLHRTLHVLDLHGNLIHYTKENVCSPFVNLTKLTDLKLDQQMPYGITLLPRAFFRGLTSLKSLYLSNNHIAFLSTDTFDDLTNLQFLTLDDSCVGITQLKPGIFKNLQKLEILMLENMGIESFSKEVFGNLTGVKVLHLNRNAMRTLDVDLLKNLTNLQYLDVRNTPLSCNCPNSELQNWTKTNSRVQLIYLYNLTCPGVNDSNFYNFDTNVCSDFGVYFFSSTYVVTLLLTLLPLLHVKLYWKFKYGYYVFRSWFAEQWRRIREEEEKCTYDAFISYNSADEEWVMEELLPNLEGSGFRVCLHHRDFEPGRNIVDNIVAAVYNSRKTVCVVSQNFLRSEWCSLEIQLASYRLFDEMQDVLLLVFLESIHERQLSAYHRMRKVMLKKTYLQWPGLECTDPAKAKGLFWKQLKRALRSSNCRGQDEEQMEENVQKEQHARAEEREHIKNQPQMDDDPYYLMP